MGPETQVEYNRFCVTVLQQHKRKNNVDLITCRKIKLESQSFVLEEDWIGISDQKSVKAEINGIISSVTPTNIVT